MSGHSRWKLLREEYGDTEDSGAKGRTVSFVQGYILALEDVLQGIDTLSENPETDYGLYQLALREMKQAVERDMASAKRTLEVLTK